MGLIQLFFFSLQLVILVDQQLTKYHLTESPNFEVKFFSFHLLTSWLKKKFSSLIY